jgi:hypothetical protein
MPDKVRAHSKALCGTCNADTKVRVQPAFDFCGPLYGREMKWHGKANRYEAKESSFPF